MSRFCELLVEEFAPYGTLTAAQLTRLERHYELLIAWNQKLNLTRIVAVEEAVQRHYAESLYLGFRLPPGVLHIADIGSGPGFPGIPIAVFRPECSVTLVDSHQRKSVFLREAIRGLPNVTVQPVRAQTLPSKFDWIVSRAVDPHEVSELRQAPSFALLVGDQDGRQLGEDWEVERLPWGDGRVIAFHVERTASNVPRGTS